MPPPPAKERKRAAGEKKAGEKKKSGRIPKEDFTCPICMEPYLHMIGQCKDGHLICNTCWYKLEARPRTCPSCRTPMPDFIRNRAVENIVGRAMIKCKWKGCTQVLALKGMYHHQDMCVHKARQCGMVTCNWKGYEDEFLDHCKAKHEKETFTLESNMLQITIDQDTLAQHHWSRTIVYKGKFYFFHCHVYDEDSSDDVFVCTVRSLTDDKLRFKLTLHDGDERVSIETRTCTVSEAMYDVDSPWKRMLVHGHELEDTRGQGGKYLVLEFL